MLRIFRKQKVPAANTAGTFCLGLLLLFNVKELSKKKAKKLWTLHHDYLHENPSNIMLSTVKVLNPARQ